MNCMYTNKSTNKSDSNSMSYVNNSFTFFSRLLITSNISSVPIVFHQFFTQIALGDVDLCFSLMLVTDANAVEEQTK